MGIFDRLFGKQPKVKLQEYFKTLNAYQPVFTTISGGLYEADITRSAIHTVAKHFSKLEPFVEGKGNQALGNKLKIKPNPWQTTSQWLYKTATILLCENNAFVVPLLDWHTKEPTTTGYYTVCPSRCEVMNYKGEAWLRYQFVTGEIGAIELRRCAILTQYQYKDDFFGESNGVINPTLQVIQTQKEGILEGIKAGASVRFIGRLAQVYNSDTIDEERKRFRESNFAKENNGGIVLIDGKYAELKQIDSKPNIVDTAQMQHINNNVFNYFGVNEKMLRNEWSEEDAIAFYEGAIEPIAVQASLGLTCMTFSDNAISFGNKIGLSSNRLEYVPAKTKLAMCCNAVDRGIMSINEARELLQYKPIDGGDSFVIRGEYTNANDKLKGANNNASKE